MGGMSARAFYGALGVEAPDQPGPWVNVRCFNPDHGDDRNPSCGVNVEHGGFACHACGAKGSAYDAAVLAGRQPHEAAALCKQHGLGNFDDTPERGGRVVPPQKPHNGATVGCTLEDYAREKQLPAGFLRDLGVSDYPDSRWPGARVLRIPYRDVEGNEPAVQLRIRLHKPTDGPDDRFLWRKGSKPFLYGLWRLCRDDYVVIVEGASDCHTLWSHNIPAVGLPGASGWKESRDAAHLDGIERIYVVVEPDTGGEAVLRWLGDSRIRDRAWLVELGDAKDPSGLHLADPERFAQRFDAALEEAEPWRERAAAIEDHERREAWALCRELAEQPRILDRLYDDLEHRGVVGEHHVAGLVYLAATSRLLERPVSIAVKGPSGAGKSYVAERALEHLPASAVYALTAMSERALAYSEEPLAHRMLVVYEAAGLAGEWASYLMRSLLSEGRVRYETVEKTPDGMKARMIERNGPTGLIVTTTAISLHAENETRHLSVTVTDTPEQTAAVLGALAGDDDRDAVDLAPWHALQRWVETGARRVVIPYARQLAQLVPPIAVRLRRDFRAVLWLIRAHALLHQAQRERDTQGRVIATLDDYEVVRELVGSVVAEGVQATVKPETRETVAAVRTLSAADDTEAGVAQAALVRYLRLDRGTISRRVRAALDNGYLRNLETRRGRPAQLVLGDPLPEDQELLPTRKRLEDPCAVARAQERYHPSPPSANGRHPADGADQADAPSPQSAVFDYEPEENQ